MADSLTFAFFRENSVQRPRPRDVVQAHQRCSIVSLKKKQLGVFFNAFVLKYPAKVPVCSGSGAKGISRQIAVVMLG